MRNALGAIITKEDMKGEGVTYKSRRSEQIRLRDLVMITEGSNGLGGCDPKEKQMYANVIDWRAEMKEYKC